MGDAGGELVQGGAGGGPGARLGVRLGEFGPRALPVEQVGRGLRDKPDQPPGPRVRHAMRIGTVPLDSDTSPLHGPSASPAGWVTSVSLASGTRRATG
ncbi:hypothetical protein ACIO13_26445 [Streptomyces sp. NPDC087425]|uniref:hypothetical protein n=1 Tax=Streptomyces sp. NPDC087425 TaxID=3365787 RepID=UPI0038023990